MSYICTVKAISFHDKSLGPNDLLHRAKFYTDAKNRVIPGIDEPSIIYWNRLFPEPKIMPADLKWYNEL